MLVNILVLLLIFLVAGYYATQGLFSAVLSLVAAIFASILAMGLFEPFSGIIASYKPAPARGVTFLLLFFLGLSACRFASDYAVPKAIKFSKMVDSIGGGLVGLFAALVTVGSLVIGVEMLPLHTNVLNVAGMGFDRYSDGMKATEPGVPESPASVWFKPDRFTLSIWKGASGRALGGSESFGDVHPDLTVESYGYRNSVQYMANSTLLPDLLTIDAAYVSDAQDVLTKTNTESGKQAAVVRIVVERGVDQPKVSADSDGWFRITASQVRLITDKGRQYYPTGILVNGTTFKALPLDSGHLVDDYVSNKVIEDWVFQIDRDEKPRYLEVKELARKELKMLEKPAAPALAASYPKRPYLLTHATLQVVVQGKNGPLKDAKVFLMPNSTKVSKVKPAVKDAYENITVAIQAINDASGQWATEQGKPGVPSRSDLLAQQAQARNRIVLIGNEEEASWSEAISTMMYGACRPDGTQNLTGLPLFFDSTVIPLLRSTPGDIRAEGVTGADGKLTLTEVAPGSYQVIASGGNSEGYGVWAEGVVLKAKEEAAVTLTLNKSLLSIIPKP